jgi:hypothetical protein
MTATRCQHQLIYESQAKWHRLAKAKGENSPYKCRKASIDRSVITDMLNAGSSVTAIARALNTSRQSIYRIKTKVAWAYLYKASQLNKHGSPEIVGELFGWPRYRPPNPRQRFTFTFAFIWSHCAELRIATFTLISPWENFGKWVNDNFPGLSFTINDKEIAVS